MKMHTNLYRMTHNETKYSEVSNLHNKGFFLYSFESEDAQNRYLEQQQQMLNVNYHGKDFR